ncbi:MAG: endopeptidase La [Eubacteriales bacterium]|nr:endopeptidase La [Eubacteriales bacterium]
MLVIPVYDLALLPGASLYLKKEYYEELAGKQAEQGASVIFLMLKQHKQRPDIKPEDIYPIAVTGVVESVDEDGTVNVRALARVRLSQADLEANLVQFVECTEIQDLTPAEIEERFKRVRGAMLKFSNQFQWGVIARQYILNWHSLAEMVTALSSQLNISSEEKYQMLETDVLSQRVELMEKALYEMIEVNRVSGEAQQAVSKSNEMVYREEAIKRQIEFLQKQLDDMHPENVSDIRKFEQAIAQSGMNDIAEKEARKVLNRMKQEGQNGHEYGLLYDYLDFVTGLSWKKAPFERIALDRAEEILDEDHYGLKKAKKRIIQQIAVMALNQKQAGSILLFVGAPGTGKTSIGQSIARALKRPYARVSLGGVRDEAEIRGHRRTYVGAMPGRIMDGIRRSGASNPVVVLDEVDKLGKDYNGDPSSALLEVLDPEQNSTFTDHYMNVPYDLSDVLFICTANSLDTIPEPLLNRMEVIRFQGYTASEKLQIAKKHLLPRAMESAGIAPQQLHISDGALRKIISDYTMESGVRGLKKRIDTLCRSAAVKLIKGEKTAITVGTRQLKEMLDRKPMRHDMAMKTGVPGVVTGLAWTQAGGDILFLETMFTKGEGKIHITGQLGDVMKESVQVAISLVKSMYPDKADMFKEYDLHVHVPDGAVPKDGPSAGITLTTALASLVTGKAVEPTVAMTGEVSLRGGVMPIGGLPEKLMAAVRAGIRTVMIPQDNEEDLEDVAEEVKRQLTIVPVSSVSQVLEKTGLR